MRAEESASSGVDVWSDAVESQAPDHLLVMVHGILGRYTYPRRPLLWFSAERLGVGFDDGLGEDAMSADGKAAGVSFPICPFPWLGKHRKMGKVFFGQESRHCSVCCDESNGAFLFILGEFGRKASHFFLKKNVCVCLTVSPGIGLLRIWHRRATLNRASFA
jgi:hypothetical protein